MPVAMNWFVRNFGLQSETTASESRHVSEAKLIPVAGVWRVPKALGPTVEVARNVISLATEVKGKSVAFW